MKIRSRITKNCYTNIAKHDICDEAFNIFKGNSIHKIEKNSLFFYFRLNKPNESADSNKKCVRCM